MPACVQNPMRMRLNDGFLPVEAMQAICGAIALACLPFFGCSREEIAVRGRVTADSRPVDRGTITFLRADGIGPAVGSVVQKGEFDLGKQKGLTSGDYRATLEGFQVTGRMINDYQRGPIPETIPLALADNALAVKISAENAQKLELDFHTTVSK